MGRKEEGEAGMDKVQLPKKFVSKYPHKFAKGKAQFLRGNRIMPKPITGKETVASLIDDTFQAYNAVSSRKKCSRRTPVSG
jgi:ABC-type oligopeptide transport system ATPase subunit